MAHRAAMITRSMRGAPTRAARVMHDVPHTGRAAGRIMPRHVRRLHSLVRRRSAGGLRPCAPAVPAVGGVRALSTSALAVADEQLESFSEAQQARTMLTEGRSSAAASLLSRVVGICESATGAASTLTLAAQRRLGSAYVQAGEFEQARAVIEAMLHIVGQDGSSGSLSVQIALLEQAYRLHTHLGAPRRAQQLCKRAAELSERVGDYSGVVAAHSTHDLAGIMRGVSSAAGFQPAIDAGTQAGAACSPYTLASAWRNRGALLFARRHEHSDEFGHNVEAAAVDAIRDCFHHARALMDAAAQATCPAQDGGDTAADAAGCGDGHGCGGGGGSGEADGDATSEEAAAGCCGDADNCVSPQGCVEAGHDQCRAVQLSDAGLQIAHGYCAVRLGLADEAEPMLSEALATYERWLSPDHPSVARALFVLGTCYHAKHKAVTAEGLYRACLEKFGSGDTLLPYQRRDMKAALLSYSHLLGQWDKRDSEADRVFSQALAVNVFPPCAFAESLLPPFPHAFVGGASVPGDMRAEVELCSAPSSLYSLGGLELELHHVGCPKCGV